MKMENGIGTRRKAKKSKLEYMNEICLGMIQRLYYEKIPQILCHHFHE